MTTTTTNLAYTGSLRPLDLKNFFRLTIPTISNVFISPDLKSQFNLVCTDVNAQYCSKADKILSCKNNYFWNRASPDNQSCAKTCTSSFPTYLYQGTKVLIIFKQNYVFKFFYKFFHLYLTKNKVISFLLYRIEQGYKRNHGFQ